MNELLGWYGYDKVELRDSDDIEIRNYPDGEVRQHISVVKGKRTKKMDNIENTPHLIRHGYRCQIICHL